MRMFKVTACVPSQTRNTAGTPKYSLFQASSCDNWFRETATKLRNGWKIVKVELATGVRYEHRAIDLNFTEFNVNWKEVQLPPFFCG